MYKKNAYFEYSGSNHTYYKISYEYHKSLNSEISTIFNQYYKSLNPFDSLSIISSVNSNKNVLLDSIFTNTFIKTQFISKITDGYFDITCAPILNQWGFGFKNTTNNNIKIDSILEFVGYEKINLINNKIIKSDPRILITFSAVGDGCVAELIGCYFDKLGIANYMIDVGGEILVNGTNKYKKKWSIGITKPDDNFYNQTVYKVIETDQRLGIATSGDYRNYYIKDGKKYAHTINPKTGFPAGQDILSATVVYKDCLIADGIATAIMTMGRKEFEKRKSNFDFIDYIIIFSGDSGEYSFEASPGLRNMLRSDSNIVDKNK